MLLCFTQTRFGRQTLRDEKSYPIPWSRSQGRHTVRLLSPVEKYIEHRLIIEVLLQTEVTRMDKFWGSSIPEEYTWMLCALVAHVAQRYHTRDCGTYNVCLLPHLRVRAYR